ncbi:MAG: pilus assembly protein PilP [Gammaproteobacteria bacterium]
MNTIYSRLVASKWTVALLLMCLEFIVGYGLDIRKLRHRLEQTQQARTSAAQAIATAQTQLTNYQYLQTQFDGWQRRFGKALQPLSQPLTLSNILQQLSAQAEQQGLKLQTMIPLKSRTNDVFTIQPIQLNALSNYASFIRFIAQLDKLSVLLKVANFALVSNNEHALPTATLTIEVYKFASEPSATKTSENKFTTILKKLNDLPFPAVSLHSPALPMRDPFAQTTLAKNQRHCKQQPLLTCFPLNDYRVLGVIQQNQQFWAIVLDPQGNLHQVTIGTRLGDQESHISHIDTQAIILTNISNPKTTTLTVEK